MCTGQEGYGRNLGQEIYMYITQSHMLSFPNVYPVYSWMHLLNKQRPPPLEDYSTGQQLYLQRKISSHLTGKTFSLASANVIERVWPLMLRESPMWSFWNQVLTKGSSVTLDILCKHCSPVADLNSPSSFVLVFTNRFISCFNSGIIADNVLGRLASVLL